MKNHEIEHYGMKEQQSRLYRAQEYHVWLTQNLNSGKTTAVMKMVEQMMETRTWKKVRELIDDSSCRVCNQYLETVEHLVKSSSSQVRTAMGYRDSIREQYSQACVGLRVPFAKSNNGKKTRPNCRVDEIKEDFDM